MWMALDNALIEAQKVGKTPAICDPNSPFQNDYKNCNECLLANGDPNNASNITTTNPQIA